LVAGKLGKKMQTHLKGKSYGEITLKKIALPPTKLGLPVKRAL
jgi:hypothetical protein